MNLQDFIDKKLPELAEKIPTLLEENPSSFPCGYAMGYKASLIEIIAFLDDEKEDKFCNESDMEKFYIMKIFKIKAFRFGFEEFPEWFLRQVGDGVLLYCDKKGTLNKIVIIEDMVTVNFGDYILCDRDGKLFSCNNDYFIENYREG